MNKIDTTVPADGLQPELDELAARQRIAREMGGPERIARQHAGGRLKVRERTDRMPDHGSCLEVGSIPAMHDR
jgi:acetyl-CoA carboxylase carboxyltransferase component